MRPLLVRALAPHVGQTAAELLAPGYFTFAALAALAGAILLARRARRDGDDVAAVLGALGLGYAAAILGGILVPMIVDLVQQAAGGHRLHLRWAGMLAYGGFLCGFAAAAWALRRTKTVSFGRFADLAAAPVGIAIALVRVGCFVAGCDYGKITSLPWGVRFPDGSPAFVDQVHAGLLLPTRTASLPVHPTQLYEALLGIFIFLAVGELSRRRKFSYDGALFLCAASLYALGRAGLETLRGDQSRGFLGPFSTSQVIGAAVLAGCAAVAFRMHRHARRLAPIVAALAIFFLAASDGHAQQLPPPGSDAQVRQAQPAGDYPPGLAPETPPPPPVVLPPEGRGIDVAGTFGFMAPLNRMDGQVPPLAAGTFTATYTLWNGFGVGLQGEVAANEVATHTTFAVVGSFHHRTPFAHVGVEGTVGFGIQSIHFKDPSFGSTGGSDWRIAGGVSWHLTRSWSIVLYPVAFDVMYDTGVGGTIVSYQMQLGVAFDTRR